jgi:hypothetical protein
MCDNGFSDMPLPSGWAKSVKSAVLYVISLAHFTILAQSRSSWSLGTTARSTCPSSR